MKWLAKLLISLTYAMGPYACSKAFLDISIDRAPRGCMITGCIQRVRHEHNIRHCFVVNIHDITDYGKQVLKK
jgi:hypothetical protein